MIEESIEVHREWLKFEDSLMTRIKEILSGSEIPGPFKHDSGYSWQLDATNDWFAEVRDGKLIIAYRYGSTPKFKTFVAYLKEELK